MRKLIGSVPLLLLVNIASATFISLTTSIPEIKIENKTQASVKITNSGDEAAFSLSISLILPESFESDKIFIERLKPNSSFEGVLNISRKKELTPGKYPATVFLEYADANSYPFSAISPTSIIYKTNTLSKVSGSISEITLIGKEIKNLVLNLKNLDEAKHEVKVKLFLPRELKASEKEKDLMLKEREEREIEFEVSNLAALEGSSYVILASIEYEENNLHYSSFATGIVKISSKEQTKNFLYVLILIYSIIAGIISFYKLKRAKKKIK